MSSLRRIQSSKANGARSKGPSTPAGKQRSSLNALRHGLCAKCIVLDHESRENFLTLLQQHIDRFQPANEVEFNMIEEMCAAYWRQRRAWSIETALLDKHIALQPDGANADRMATAFDTLAAAPTLPLLHRYETRQHLMYQRALRTFIMLRTVTAPNDPNPIPEQVPSPPVRQPSRPVVSPVVSPVVPSPVVPSPVVPSPVVPGPVVPSPVVPGPVVPGPVVRTSGATGIPACRPRISSPAGPPQPHPNPPAPYSVNPNLRSRRQSRAHPRAPRTPSGAPLRVR